MQIIHKIDKFLYTIFPSVSPGDHKSLVTVVQDFYTLGTFKPNVSVDGEYIIIKIDTPSIEQELDYQKVIRLCETQKFSEAKPILHRLIDKNPSVSEYHRIMGQILSDEGNQDEAINFLIDALRWDSKNAWALVMMGNIFARSREDVDTALKYYNQALLVNPNDHITLNNIGANLIQQGDIEEAKRFFWEALKSDNTYPNTHFALGMIAEMENDLPSAFHSTISAIKTNKNKDILYQNSLKQSLEIANKLVKEDTGKLLYRKYRAELEIRGDREIDILEDNDIPTVAKFEFAENYQREKHLIKYKPEAKGVAHLIMHELVHLDLVIEARKNEVNELFISNQQNKSSFFSILENDIKKLKKDGHTEATIANYMNALFDGMNRQIFNAPIDLFIENKLYIKYPELRPYQYISLYNIVNEGLDAVTRKEIVSRAPKSVLSKSKVYNIVGALQFKDLYGIDLIKDYQASPIDLKLATKFYEEFLQYRDDRKPGEEYELVQHWAEDLNLDKNFELVNEIKFRETRSNVDSILENIEANPIEDFSTDPSKVKKMDTFQQAHSDKTPNMAVVMFMVDALKYFKTVSTVKIKEIAFEIAMQGTQGYDPNKKDYRIRHIKDKTFSGYHILAYYYVSWSLAIPEMVNQLGLPFNNEFEMAKAFVKQ